MDFSDKNNCHSDLMIIVVICNLSDILVSIILFQHSRLLIDCLMDCYDYDR